jgi:acyl-CoA thioesterase
MDTDALARKVADHLRAREGTGKAFDIVIDEVREGYARIHMVVRADMLNGHGVAHGGMIFTLADTAFAYACNSRNVSTMANQASIVFLSPGKEGERLTAEAREQAVSGRSGVYQIRVTGEDGRDVAAFQGLSRSVGGAVIN